MDKKKNILPTVFHNVFCIFLDTIQHLVGEKRGIGDNLHDNHALVVFPLEAPQESQIYIIKGNAIIIKQFWSKFRLHLVSLR